MKQFVPQEVCLKCQGCCRYRDQHSPFRPVFDFFDRKSLAQKGLPVETDSAARIIDLKSGNNLYFCPFFDIEGNRCTIYKERPFDCRFYPFMLVRKGRDIVLCADKNCPFVGENKGTPEFKSYVRHIKDYLKTPQARRKILLSLEMVDYYPKADLITLDRVPDDRLLLKFKELAVEDKSLFDAYPYKVHSYHSFPVVYMNRGLSRLLKFDVEDDIAVFSVHEKFAYVLVFLSKDFSMKKLEYLFEVLVKLSEENAFCVIDNVPALFVQNIKKFIIKESFADYLYQREKLVDLKGDPYKTLRWEINHFTQNYTPSLKPLGAEDKDLCINLYKEWIDSKERDKYSLTLCGESLLMLEEVFDKFDDLQVEGKILFVEDKPVGFTIGQGLSINTYLIIFETVLPAYKGASTHLFTEFIRDKSYEYINTMDDSGIDSLIQRKMLFKPIRFENRFKILISTFR